MDINESINQLLLYGLLNDLIESDDFEFMANRLVDFFKLDKFENLYNANGIDVPPYETRATHGKLLRTENIDEILAPMLDYAVKNGLISNDTVDERDLFDTAIMGLLTPAPSVVRSRFKQDYTLDPVTATHNFYKLSKVSNYIRTQRIKKDKQWKVNTVYGELDLTINLSKPEKDPKSIALAKTLKTTGYPKCVLCKENVGFSGHLNHPARQNLRAVPLEFNSKSKYWYLQYSPYVYYNEHCIVFSEEHKPMKITPETFEILLQFVDKFKHYFAGSNADLPIVGGSILSHDHFQGGAYNFAMNKAEVIEEYQYDWALETKVQHLKWPLTTLRIKGENIKEIIKVATRILKNWKVYSDETLGVHAFSDSNPHNTITPIARFDDTSYELDLVLRNNRTSAEFEDGIFHPHKKYHHLKKENIGLIEVMGLAILPGRLIDELAVLKEALMRENDEALKKANLEKHIPWYNELVGISVEEGEVEYLINESIGIKFAEILECCGVFKLDEAGISGVRRFLVDCKGMVMK